MNKVIEAIKRRILWGAYYFVPIQKNKIVISNYYGRGYGDNPKYIANELLKLKDKYPISIIWLVKSQEAKDSLPEGIQACEYGSADAIYHLTTARIWLDNCRRTFFYKKKGQYYIQTWHGFALKRIEKDVEDSLGEKYVTQAKMDSAVTNLIVSDSHHMTNIYKNSFWYNGRIVEWGSPRNDRLIIDEQINVKRIKQYFNLSDDTKTVLYAPTFRADGSLTAYNLDYEKVCEAFSQRFGGKYVVLIRLHPNVMEKSRDLVFDNRVTYDASGYPDIQELLSGVDAVISDYSSLMFDFAITKKPCFQYAVDIEDYRNDRNFYFDLNLLPFPLATNNQEMHKVVIHFNEDKYSNKLNDFMQKVGIICDGKASRKCAKLIINKMFKDKKMLNKALTKYKNLPLPARASFWFLICSFLQKGISVITTPIFTRLLTTHEYGQFSVFNSWLGIITIIVTMDLYAGVYTQGLVKFDDDKKRFASSLQGLTLTLTIIWTVVYWIAHSFWNSLFNLTTVQMLAMLLMIWTTAVFNFWAAEKRVEYSYRSLVITTLIVSVAKPVVGIIFVINANDKVTARILGLALVEVIGYFWMFISQMRQGKTFYNKWYWKYAVGFNLPLIPHYLSQIVLNNSDRIMINSMVGSSEAGIYSLAYSLAQIMILFNTALIQTIEPWIYQKIKAKKTDDIARLAYPAMIFIACVNILLISLAPEIVAIFAPKAYYDAIWVIPPIAMSVFFLFTYCFFADFEFYFEKTKFIMMASIVGAVLNIILNYIFIKIFGYYAAGYTTLFCYILYSLGHYWFMRKVCKECMNGIKVYEPKIIAAIALVFMISGFGIMATYNYPIIRYSILAVIVVLIIVFRNKIKQLIKEMMNIRASRNSSK